MTLGFLAKVASKRETPRCARYQNLLATRTNRVPKKSEPFCCLRTFNIGLPQQCRCSPETTDQGPLFHVFVYYINQICIFVGVYVQFLIECIHYVADFHFMRCKIQRHAALVGRVAGSCGQVSGDLRRAVAARSCDVSCLDQGQINIKPPLV